jgi:HD-GYP domain-containing protein (c-di-GMP phosphodiesterase class II)
VAERYDRLTSDFAAQPLKREEALSIMKSESGKILDGSIVEVLAGLEGEPERRTGSGKKH